MSDGTYRGRWVDEVFRTPHVSAEVKVFLLFLATYYMREEGRVSEPRNNLAKEFGCDPRNITAKFKAAIAAGLLEQTVRGQKHQTAVYQAVVPGFPQGDRSRHPEKKAQGDDSRHPERSQGDGFYHPENPAQGDADYHPETAQGDDTRPAEGSQGDDTHHPTYREQIEEGDNGAVAEVITLFDEEKIKTPPADGAAAPAPERQPTPAQSVVAAYVEGVKEATGTRPGDRRIGHIAKQAKAQAARDDRDLDLLVKAARSLGQKVARNLIDLDQEYLIVAAEEKQAATGTDGRPMPSSAGNGKYAPGSGSQVPPRTVYKKEGYI